eukprot:gene18137-24577_t
MARRKQAAPRRDRDNVSGQHPPVHEQDEPLGYPRAPVQAKRARTSSASAAPEPRSVLVDSSPDLLSLTELLFCSSPSGCMQHTQACNPTSSRQAGMDSQDAQPRNYGVLQVTHIADATARTLARLHMIHVIPVVDAPTASAAKSLMALLSNKQLGLHLQRVDSHSYTQLAADMSNDSWQPSRLVTPAAAAALVKDLTLPEASNSALGSSAAAAALGKDLTLSEASDSALGPPAAAAALVKDLTLPEASDSALVTPAAAASLGKDLTLPEASDSALGECHATKVRHAKGWQNRLLEVLRWLLPHGFSVMDRKGRAGGYEVIWINSALIRWLNELIPRLRPYQKRAVAWMLARERGEDGADTSLAALPEACGCLDVGTRTRRGYLKLRMWPAASGGGFRHPLWRRVHSLGDDGASFLLNPYTGMICLEQDMDALAGFRTGNEVAAVRGGILADEMGLGKTVELLACITANRFKEKENQADGGSLKAEQPGLRHGCKNYKQNNEVVAVRGDILADEMGLGKTVELLACITANRFKKKGHQTGGGALKAEQGTRGSKEESIDCTCGYQSQDINDEDGYTGIWVFCEACASWMHGACVGLKQIPRGAFTCTRCMRLAASTQVHSPCGATLVVCPPAILPQWVSEIRRHTHAGALRVVVYNGQQQKSSSLEDSIVADVTAPVIRADRRRGRAPPPAFHGPLAAGPNVRRAPRTRIRRAPTWPPSQPDIGRRALQPSGQVRAPDKMESGRRARGRPSLRARSAFPGGAARIYSSPRAPGQAAAADAHSHSRAPRVSAVSSASADVVAHQIRLLRKDVAPDRNGR